MSKRSKYRLFSFMVASNRVLSYREFLLLLFLYEADRV